MKKLLFSVNRATSRTYPVGKEVISLLQKSGGFISDEKGLGYSTIVDMGYYYGIGEIKCISVDGIDIPTTNVAEAINAAIEALPEQL